MKHRNSSPRLTPILASKIKGLWAHSPLNQAQIAARLGELNQGRVSEVITGQKFPDVPPADLPAIRHYM
ncbi:hypothetical protein EFQ99_32605 [Rhizobium vallis]|uniref:Uncharacterized protein n=2 Tax=Rhizobium TaxID=379 RepID=A0A2A6J2V6_9HYPH|nr:MULTISPECIES: hypothetical protein [Rhizobium]PDS28294.1 hypothetical protein CO650_26930 [Rhizobium phaseoli]PDT00486.1 hypothetical protein CO666_30210 [Rhizobium chutanense]RUM18441.1 hypothetical protein EFQ99_32605 [Rhizobium vallis]